MRRKYEHHAIFAGTKKECQEILKKKEESGLMWKEIIRKGLGMDEEE